MKTQLQARALSADYGWRWISEGFSLFRKNPMIWIVLTIILFFIGFAMSLCRLRASTHMIGAGVSVKGTIVRPLD